MDLRRRSAERLAAARQVLDSLSLIDRWRTQGDPALVGSVALDLVVRPDIDLEIFAENPTPRDGFHVVTELSELPGIREARYQDSRNDRGAGLYWKVVYEDDTDQRWTLDMWLFDMERRSTSAAAMVEPIRNALTDETRDAILRIKEDAVAVGARAHGHWLYRAVLNEGVRTYPDYLAWIGDQDVWERTTWRP